MGSLIAERHTRVPNVVAVGADDTVADAIELLRQHEISQLPVVTGTMGGDGSRPFAARRGRRLGPGANPARPPLPQPGRVDPPA